MTILKGELQRSRSRVQFNDLIEYNTDINTSSIRMIRLTSLTKLDWLFCRARATLKDNHLSRESAVIDKGMASELKSTITRAMVRVGDDAISTHM